MNPMNKLLVMLLTVALTVAGFLTPGKVWGATTVRFAVIGDYGQDSQAEADVATLVKSWNPYFIITTGDNRYGQTPIDNAIGRYYCEYIGNYKGTYCGKRNAWSYDGSPAKAPLLHVEWTGDPVNSRVRASTDDAEESLTNNGSMYLNSTDLELVYDGPNYQMVGMRFTAITIPRGATISRAYIQFTADEEPTSESTSLTIQGQASSNALPFSTTSKNISSRPKTSASVAWSPSPWNPEEGGPNQRTPDIKSIIQEIVNRADWSSGNSLAIIVSAPNRFFPSLGNHDWSDGGGDNEYLGYFDLPGKTIPSSNPSGNERYYDFIQGPVHFFAIDSDPREPYGITPDSRQGTWLRTGLARSTSPWKLVYMHHPPFSSGLTHGSSVGMRWPYKTWGADAVLAGHDHTYERISSCRDSLPYFVNGLGGASIYAFGSFPLSCDSRGYISQKRYGSNTNPAALHGAMLVNASNNMIAFQFIPYTGGNPIDTYTLRKQSFQDGVFPTATYAGTRDTYISQHEPTANFGASTPLRVDGDDPGGTGKDLYTLIKWDVSAIPAGRTVKSARITINVTNPTGGTYELYRISTPWDESQVTWNTRPTMGATVRGTVTASSIGTHTITLDDEGVALVQDWVNNAATNYGIRIVDTSVTDGLAFDSSEVSTASKRPKLTITYE